MDFFLAMTQILCCLTLYSTTLTVYYEFEEMLRI